MKCYKKKKKKWLQRNRFKFDSIHNIQIKFNGFKYFEFEYTLIFILYKILVLTFINT